MKNIMYPFPREKKKRLCGHHLFMFFFVNNALGIFTNQLCAHVLLYTRNKVAKLDL